MSVILDQLWNNVDVINRASGFGLVVVCCTTEKQAQYWQQRLDKGKGQIVGKNSLVVTVYEDWPGGAGNALGTLYAYKNAMRIAQERYGIDINKELKDGSLSLGLYHTAGKGTRLAPLPGAENNNKPGVKLPGLIEIDGNQVPITILEAVIKQTGVYGSCRKGRLSVFWGDQVFIPSVEDMLMKPTHHADILCALGPMPSSEEWKANGLDKYGLIAVNNSGNAAQVEKVSYDAALSLLSHLGDIDSVGTSLGSFSVSYPLLDIFMNEFSTELVQKAGHMDSDPHLWMPMTLDLESYMMTMEAKGVDRSTSRLHYQRIARAISDLPTDGGSSGLGLFGAVDVGKQARWWDYGQLAKYIDNVLLITKDTDDARLCRKFLNVPPTARGPTTSAWTGCKATVDTKSVALGCVLGGGRVVNSVLCNVNAEYIDVEDCVVINTSQSRLTVRPGSLVYNVVGDIGDAYDSGNSSSSSNGELVVEPTRCVAGVVSKSKAFLMHASCVGDQGKLWKVKQEDNDYSYEEVWHLNLGTDLEAVEMNSIRIQRKYKNSIRGGAGKWTIGSLCCGGSSTMNGGGGGACPALFSGAPDTVAAWIGLGVGLAAVASSYVLAHGSGSS